MIMAHMIDLNPLWPDYLGISWTGALGVVISTIVLYLFFTLLVNLSGTRLMATMSTASFGVLAVVGGVSARSMLGKSPRMLAALLALNTLMVMDALMGTFRRIAPVLPAAVRRRPSVVMLEGSSRAEALRRRGLTEAGLHDRLRIGGVLDPALRDGGDLHPQRSVVGARVRQAARHGALDTRADDRMADPGEGRHAAADGPGRLPQPHPAAPPGGGEEAVGRELAHRVMLRDRIEVPDQQQVLLGVRRDHLADRSGIGGP